MPVKKTTAMVVAAGLAAEDRAAERVGGENGRDARSTKETGGTPVQRGAINFVVDDGFRLESVPTLEWYEKRIPEAYEMHRRGGQMHLLGAFLCGWLQLGAQQFIGKARRGIHGRGDAGLMNWKAKTFPTISSASLGNHLNYAKAIFSKSRNHKADSLNSNTCNFRIGKPDTFKLPATPGEWEALYDALALVTDGKTVTAFLREARLIRQALPKVNGGGKRGTEEQTARKQRLMQVKIAFREVTSQTTSWLENKWHHDLMDGQLLEVQANLAALKSEVDALVAARKLKGNS